MIRPLNPAVRHRNPEPGKTDSESGYPMGVGAGSLVLPGPLKYVEL